MNGLLRIRQRYQGLAQSDKKLADYLLLQPDTARHLSSQQLANEAGVIPERESVRLQFRHHNL